MVLLLRNPHKTVQIRIQRCACAFAPHTQNTDFASTSTGSWGIKPVVDIQESQIQFYKGKLSTAFPVCLFVEHDIALLQKECEKLIDSRRFNFSLVRVKIVHFNYELADRNASREPIL